MIAREGSIANASKLLHLTPQTLSSQLLSFENYLETPLFERKGRRLILNKTGKLTYQYADDIFTLGGELQKTLSSKDVKRKHIFTVGVTDVVPKVLAFELLKPCLKHEENIQLICREGDQYGLLTQLAINKIDLIISDRPITPDAPIRAYNHLIGESGLTFFSQKPLSSTLQSNFPYSLHNQPFLVCGDKSNQKIALTSWFNELNISPDIQAEFDDSALMKFFGQAGYGCFCTASIIEQNVQKLHHVSIVGRTKTVKEQFYIITPDRKINHPIIKSIAEASEKLFKSTLSH